MSFQIIFSLSSSKFQETDRHVWLSSSPMRSRELISVTQARPEPLIQKRRHCVEQRSTFFQQCASWLILDLIDVFLINLSDTWWNFKWKINSRWTEKQKKEKEYCNVCFKSSPFIGVSPVCMPLWPMCWLLWGSGWPAFQTLKAAPTHNTHRWWELCQEVLPFCARSPSCWDNPARHKPMDLTHLQPECCLWYTLFSAF